VSNAGKAASSSQTEETLIDTGRISNTGAFKSGNVTEVCAFCCFCQKSRQTTKQERSYSSTFPSAFKAYDYNKQSTEVYKSPTINTQEAKVQQETFRRYSKGRAVFKAPGCQLAILV
jgi:hypothetical protein